MIIDYHNITVRDDPRYMTIARPRSPHLSLTFTSLFVAVIWSVSVVVAVPTLLYSTTISYDDDNMETRRVLMLGSRGEVLRSTQSLQSLHFPDF